jgi:hypothetical protein
MARRAQPVAARPRKRTPQQQPQHIHQLGSKLLVGTGRRSSERQRIHWLGAK